MSSCIYKIQHSQSRRQHVHQPVRKGSRERSLLQCTIENTITLDTDWLAAPHPRELNATVSHCNEQDVQGKRSSCAMPVPRVSARTAFGVWCAPVTSKPSEKPFLLLTNAATLPAASPSAGSSDGSAAPLHAPLQLLTQIPYFYGQKTHWIHLREETSLLNEYITRETSLKRIFMTA